MIKRLESAYRVFRETARFTSFHNINGFRLSHVIVNVPLHVSDGVDILYVRGEFVTTGLVEHD